MKDLDLRRIVVDCGVIEENFKLIGRFLGESTRPIWVVKSRAYGSGLECIQHVSPDIAGYGVEDFEAAGEVLRLDGSRPIYIIYPISPAYCPPAVLDRVWDGAIVPTVASKEQIDQWLSCAREAGADGFEIQIKVRSFGGRFGVHPEELEEVVTYAREHRLRIGGIFSHPAHSTVSSDAELREECERFVKLARGTAPEALVHFSDSTCVLKGIGVDLDLVRVGMLPLGLLPVKADERWSSLRLALTLYARVISLHTLADGESVGYARHEGKAPSHVAIVAIGYAHGVPRVIAEAGFAWWRGRRMKYAGPLWMEFSALTLSEEQMGILDEEVEIIGPNAPPHLFAWRVGKVTEEFVVRLSPSIVRQVKL